MKKLLFSCLLFLIAMMTNAQITVSESFEGSSLPTGWTSTNGTGTSQTPSFGTSAGAACLGSKAMTKNVYGSTTNSVWYPVYTTTASNGEVINYSFQYLVKPYSSTVNCKIGAEYSVDGGTTWVSLMADVSITTTTTCTTVSGTIPAGTVASGANFMFRLRASSVGSGDQYIGFDNVVLSQLANTAPVCPTVSGPADAATNIAVLPTISWGIVNGATNYLINVGTTPGGTDVLNMYNVGNVTSYTLTNTLNYSRQYYYSIIASNAVGMSSGCLERSFTTKDIGCPSVTAPSSASATGVAIMPTITWSALTDATGYKLSVGTTAGGTDVLNNVDLGNATSYVFSAPLLYGTKYYYTVNAYTPTSNSVSCTERNFTTIALCPTVSAPTSAATNVSTTPTFTWSAINGVTGYRLTIGTTSGGNDVLNAFDVGNVTTYTLPNALNHDTTYYYSVVAYAGSQVGATCTIRNFKTSIAPPACGGVFVDTGGVSGNYSSNESKTWVITPTTPGDLVTVTFSSFATESGYDYLKVYDGPDATYPALHTGSGFSGALTLANLPGPFTSTDSSGALTFVFTSDSSTTAAGWMASVTCAPPPTCIKPTNVSSSYEIATGNVLVNWTAPASVPANGYDIYYSTSSTSPDGSTVLNTTNSVTSTTTSATITGLTPETVYYVWVRSNCSTSDKSGWSVISSVTTGYCEPTGGTANQYYLKTISTTGATTNISYTATSYSAYVNNTTTLLTAEQGMVINYSLTPSGGTNYFYIWVDWNNNASFEDANETILSTSSYASTNSGTFTIPAGQAPGMYRMRVANSWSGSIVSCGPAPSGGYVDFTLNITNGNLATVETSSNKDNIKVYPNPFSDVLNISDVNKVKSISIMDTSGKMVKYFEKAEAQLRLSDLSSGMYIVVLNMKDGSKQTIKAIKK